VRLWLRGKMFDSPFLPKLIEDLEADYVLADGAYWTKSNFRAVEEINDQTIIVQVY